MCASCVRRACLGCTDMFAIDRTAVVVVPAQPFLDYTRRDQTSSNLSLEDPDPMLHAALV
jgi:hypothetical protein